MLTIVSGKGDVNGKMGLVVWDGRGRKIKGRKHCINTKEKQSDLPRMEACMDDVGMIEC